MINIKGAIIMLLLTMGISAGAAPDTLKLTLEQAIEMAKENSFDAIRARHSFKSAYWSYRSYQANYLPSLDFSLNPVLNRSINKVTLSDGSEKFIEQNLLTTQSSLIVNQNLSFTGGTLFMKTNLQRLDLLTNNDVSYNSTPIQIGYSQSLLGFNSLKWDKKREPIRYQHAKKEYVEALELVALRTTNKFFGLAIAQTNLNIAQYNSASADTLYRFAHGRYNIGTISENEMLQLEINMLTEQANVMNAKIEVDNANQSLRSYLGINNDTGIEVIVDQNLPDIIVPVEKAIAYAYENNPDIDYMLLRRLDSESNVAYVKSSIGLKADMYMQFGLMQTSDKIDDAYRNPLDQQYISLGISIPIIDWGRGKGKVKVAKSNRDMVKTQLEQEKVDFEQNIRNTVKQFNIQPSRVKIAAKNEVTSQKRYNLARHLYLTGKSTIIDLNLSISEKDSAKRNYINTLFNFWSMYYAVRTLTLYNFRDNRVLTEDYQLLIK